MCIRDRYIPPHIVRAVGHPDSLNKRYNTKIVVPINQNYFDLIIEGMEKAVTAGTATIAMLPEIRVAAKTGTAQDPPRKSHSVFIAFAPVDNPKIAIGCLLYTSLNTLEKIYDNLINQTNEILLSEAQIERAKISILRMIEFAEN